MHRITTAVLLAAGLGNRLRPFTDIQPKCLVKAGGSPLLEHMIKALEQNGFKRLIIVTGYKSSDIVNYVNSNPSELTIEFVHNEVYDVTNNIYSLYKVIPLLNEGFVLLESDLVFEPKSLSHFIEPDRMALDIYNSTTHSGTTAMVNDEGYAERLYLKNDADHEIGLYKTVNITSLSVETWQFVKEEIRNSVARGEVNSFYEKAFLKLMARNMIRFKMVDYSQTWWDEVDTVEDLERVNTYLENQMAWVLSE
jgi:choline kinase